MREQCVEIALAYEDSEDIEALVGLAESQGVGDKGWIKDALHSRGGNIARDIAAAIRALPVEGSKDEN